jgi:hypothetical protein
MHTVPHSLKMVFFETSGQQQLARLGKPSEAAPTSTSAPTAPEQARNQGEHRPF